MRAAQLNPRKIPQKNVSKTHDSDICVYEPNLGVAQTFSNEFSGAPRVHQKLHMACGLAHKQPQPKQIGVSRIMAKKLTKN